MVIAVVIPSFDTRTAANRDVAEANLYFPEGNDIGTDIVDIPIVLVYNNDHHYVGTRSLKRNFKDGIDSLSYMLKDRRILGDTLQQLVEDVNCKKLISKVSETCMGFHYEVDKMIQTALEIQGLEEAVEPSKKRVRRDSGQTRKRLTRDGKTSFDDLTCHCGVQKQSQAELDDHVNRRHEGKGVLTIDIAYGKVVPLKVSTSIPSRNMYRISTSGNSITIANTVFMVLIRPIC